MTYRYSNSARCVLVAVLACMGAYCFAGDVTGTVTFKGKPRTPRPVRMAADAACTHEQAPVDEKLVLGEGKDGVYPVSLAFVYVKSGVPVQEYPVPTTPVVVDQKGCTYIPHVVGVQAGQEVQFKNSDNTMHNVHVISEHSPTFNRGMPAGAPHISCKFVKQEIMAKGKCDAHPWMGIYIGVCEHPFFAVTGLDGKFALSGLPDGKYEVEVWQQLLATQSAQVTVANGAGTLDFQYERAASGN